MNKLLRELQELYSFNKVEISKRLSEFEKIWLNGSDETIFSELLFCLLTPQSKAKICGKCVQNILNKKLLKSGNIDEIKKELIGVRFKNKKAEYIVEARTKFSKNGNILIKSELENILGVVEKREYLVQKIKGIGYKEAGHFLRNIGFGSEIAILDRHILKNLKIHNVITEIPASISKKKYLAIESKMKKFSIDAHIPLDHLDLLFWFKEAGEIYK